MLTISVTTTTNTEGYAFESRETVAYDNTVKSEPSVAAAKAGTLATRSSATAGTLTLGSGHGITDGQRIDIYFSGGYAYGATVGTVSGTSVPFTGAVGTAGTGGEALPAQTSAVTACVANEESFNVTAANLKYLSAYSPVSGVSALAVFAESDNTVVKVAPISGGPGAYQWTVGSGAASPFGDNVAKVFMSHNNTTQSVSVIAVAKVS
jgi:hypothetical protein